MPNNILLWTIIAFISGSIPFSVIIGYLFLRTDIRSLGDGNPGATNVFRAGSKSWGLLAVFLDIAKGFLPVYWAGSHGLAEWQLVPISLAPALGHAFSPFFRFRGGKALAATGGSWLALIGPAVFPIYASLTLPVLSLVVEHAWAASAGMGALLFYALLFDGSGWLSAYAALSATLIFWTHRRELRLPLRLRPWVGALFARGRRA
ncbi:MAG: glycerol-3-phosphate acyltransferase [Chloroflexi bacterium]|nr:glycerol-3-phosphate acyltransferase [Chloroflexota bacterium]